MRARRTQVRARCSACCACRSSRARQAATWACSAALRRSGRGRLLSSRPVACGSMSVASRLSWRLRWPGHRQRLWAPLSSRAQASRLRVVLVRGRLPSVHLSALFPFPFAVYLCFAFLVVCSAVKRSMAAVLSPLSNLGAYEISSSSLTSAIVPLSAASALVSSAISSSPFSFALAVLHARPLLPGQPLPQGVAALGLALPILQQR